MLKNTLACLALAFMCAATSAQVTITDIGATPPTPGANDISLSFPNFQGNDGLNYYWDNATPPGQTFTTGSNAGGYTLTNLSFQTAGGGNNQNASQSFTLEIYAIPDGINATLVSSNSVTGQLTSDGHWIQVNGLGVPLSPNSEYAYTWHGSVGYEQLANDNANPYAGGQICLIPAGVVPSFLAPAVVLTDLWHRTWPWQDSCGRHGDCGGHWNRFSNTGTK